MKENQTRRRMMIMADGSETRRAVMDWAVKVCDEVFQVQITVPATPIRAVDLLPGLAEVKGDRVRLQQVLLNLLTNAMEAMRGTSSKVLTIRSAMDASDTVTVSVSDSGTGIPAASLDRVFEPFFTTRASGSGTGLGLSVSYGIVKNHKGDIRVESKVGVGTTFTIEFPIYRHEESGDE